MAKKRVFQKKNTTISKRVKPPALKTWNEVEEFEAPPPESVPEVKKKARKKYPSPQPTNVLFTQKWNIFIEDVCERTNFKPGHLHQLEILCSLYVQLEKLEALLDKNGMTYEALSRNGLQIKPRPELLQKNRVLSEIRNYCKMLGLLLVKDNKFTDDSETDDWS